MATEQLVRPIEAKSGSKSPLKHIRCCKPNIPKGLCRAGGPAGPVRVMYPRGDTCNVCWEMWKEHQMECPTDAPGWGK